jgi:hypothetical protein
MWPFSAIRSSRALDSGKPVRAEKDQALVHAALRDAASDAASDTELSIDERYETVEKQPGQGRHSDGCMQRAARVRAIMHRVQEVGAPLPLPWWQARRGVVMACGAMLVAGAAVTIYANVAATPWRLDSVPIVRSILKQNRIHTAEQLASQQSRVQLTDDAAIACADAPTLAAGERWMSPVPAGTQRQNARLAVAQLRDAQAQTASRSIARTLTLDDDLAREALALRAQLDQAADTVLSRLPGQSEPK